VLGRVGWPGDAQGAASLMAICAQRLPLDEARPEVIGYLYEVAATAADAVTAQAARARAQALLDATGLVMPAFVSLT
jgi:hypothetical protein